MANSAYTFVMDLTTSEHKTAHVPVTAMGPGDAQLAGIESNHVGKIAAGTASDVASMPLRGNLTALHLP